MLYFDLYERIPHLDGGRPTLDSDMDVILGLFRLPGVFIGFGEGVCREGQVSAKVAIEKPAS